MSGLDFIRLMAGNNAFANDRLLSACTQLDAAAFAAALSERTRGWVFRLDPALFRVLARSRDALLGAGR